MYIYCTTEAHMCHHWNSGKAISIIYSVCVFVVLGIQHAQRMRSILGQGHTILTSRELMWCYACSWDERGDLTLNSVTQIHTSVTLLTSRDLTWSSGRLTRQHASHISVVAHISWGVTNVSSAPNICPVGAELFHANGRMDGHGKANSPKTGHWQITRSSRRPIAKVWQWCLCTDICDTSTGSQP